MSIPKSKRWESKKYRQWVSTLPCIICLKTPSAPHHVKIKGHGGMSRKPSDYWCIPLCHEHHLEIHNAGKRTFAERHNIDYITEVCKICQQFITQKGGLT